MNYNKKCLKLQYLQIFIQTHQSIPVKNLYRYFLKALMYLFIILYVINFYHYIHQEELTE